ncbi:hypothetical protein [Paracoccus sp. TOH]|uniref:Uncharacterized protein n=1 Tax=Paracoccus simplex TaxID=2086346 RepID=A0ABV7S5C4_9RHOB|nr:hypothetical protein [Paracoccus sp. TOH]WJS85991.1 hypothetical protein NBE95_11300 [Paracoccus sp. TOH]
MSGAVTLHVGALSLPGLTEAEAARAARAFEAELTALLERHGLPPGIRPADLERIDLGRLPAGAGTPEAMGRELARALLRRLGP